MNENKIEKRAAITKLVIWAIVAVILIGVLCIAVIVQGSGSGGILNAGIVNVYSGEVYDDPDSYSVGERVYFEQITNLDITWAAGKIDFAVWQGDTVKIEENGQGDNEDDFLRSKVVNGTLIIKYAKSGIRIFKTYPEKSLKIYLPADMAKKIGTIDIDVASADINFTGIYVDAATGIEQNSFVIKKLDIDAASGNLSASGIAADKVDIDTASGDVYLDGDFGDIYIDAASANVTVSGVIDEIEVSAASGDLDIRGEVNSLELSAVSGDVIVETFEALPVRIDIEAVSGNVSLTLPDIESGFDARLDSVSGSLTSNVGVGKNIVYGAGIARYDFESVSGSVNITVRVIPNTRD